MVSAYYSFEVFNKFSKSKTNRYCIYLQQVSLCFFLPYKEPPDYVEKIRWTRKTALKFGQPMHCATHIHNRYTKTFFLCNSMQMNSHNIWALSLLIRTQSQGEPIFVQSMHLLKLLRHSHN